MKTFRKVQLIHASRRNDSGTVTQRDTSIEKRVDNGKAICRVVSMTTRGYALSIVLE